jgi:hypothetical protein
MMHGVRAKRSCESQIISLIHELSQNNDKNIQTDLIVMDFAKAFDKVQDVCTYINIFFQYSSCDGVRISSFTRVYVFDEFINTIPINFYEFHCGMSTRTKKPAK